jgi:hypothetical protein
MDSESRSRTVSWDSKNVVVTVGGERFVGRLRFRVEEQNLSFMKFVGHEEPRSLRGRLYHQ